MIVEININPKIVENSKKRAQKIGKLNNSILEGAGNIYGCIGEEIVSNFINSKIQNTYDYDLIKKQTTFDVKTKKTTVTPKLFFECSVADFNTEQKCDYYIFSRVLKDYSKGWILGYISKMRFYKEAKFLKKGDFDPSNNYTVHADCYNIAINQLSPIKELLKF